MCPACWTSLAITAASATGAVAALTTLVVRITRPAAAAERSKPR
ncbi:MAG: hypothetical protein ACTHU0_12480 [Kofleriaceae bacterium]